MIDQFTGMSYSIYHIIKQRKCFDDVTINHMNWMAPTINKTIFSCLLSKQIKILEQTLLIQIDIPVSISFEPHQSNIDEMIHTNDWNTLPI